MTPKGDTSRYQSLRARLLIERIDKAQLRFKIAFILPNSG